MDRLVSDMEIVWRELELPFTGQQCNPECQFCHKPILFDRFEARSYKQCADADQQFVCDIPNCPQLVAAAV